MGGMGASNGMASKPAAMPKSSLNGMSFGL
jgi:hypothetical protein